MNERFFHLLCFHGEIEMSFNAVQMFKEKRNSQCFIITASGSSLHELSSVSFSWEIIPEFPLFLLQHKLYTFQRCEKQFLSSPPTWRGQESQQECWGQTNHNGLCPCSIVPRVNLSISLIHHWDATRTKVSWVERDFLSQLLTLKGYQDIPQWTQIICLPTEK